MKHLQQMVEKQIVSCFDAEHQTYQQDTQCSSKQEFLKRLPKCKFILFQYVLDEQMIRVFSLVSLDYSIRSTHALSGKVVFTPLNLMIYYGYGSWQQLQSFNSISPKLCQLRPKKHRDM